MKKIKQEIHDGIKGYSDDWIGDCWRACVASVLELDLKSVPHFADIWTNDSPISAQREYVKFLAKHNFAVYGISVELSPGIIFNNSGFPKLHRDDHPYYFAIGHTEDGEGVLKKQSHMVVAKGTEIVHDPHPSNRGLASIDVFEILVPINN